MKLSFKAKNPLDKLMDNPDISSIFVKAKAVYAEKGRSLQNRYHF